MGKERFYFHLMEVTIVQMLKAHGFDKAASSQVLELLTDITIRYFNLITKTVLKYVELRDDLSPNIKDITDAFLDLGVIDPSNRLDEKDIDSLNDQGIENFEKWFNHDMNTRMREIARPDLEFLENRKKEKMKKSNEQNSKMDSLTKALDEQSKQAQMHNPTMPYLPPPSTKATPTPFNSFSNSIPTLTSNEINAHDDIEADTAELDYDIPASAIDEDWIQYLIRDQITTFLMSIKLNKNKTQSTNALNNNKDDDINHLRPTNLKGTVLEEYTPEDLKVHVVGSGKNEDNHFLIDGPIPEKLLHAFPYYKSDSDSSDTEEDESESGLEDSHSEDKEIQTNKLAAYDYYEHHNLYDDDEMEDVDLYGQGDTHDLNLFG